MDHPTSGSPIERPAKRQCRASEGTEDVNKLQIRPQQSPDDTIVEAEVSQAPLVATNEVTKLHRFQCAHPVPL